MAGFRFIKVQQVVRKYVPEPVFQRLLDLSK